MFHCIRGSQNCGDGRFENKLDTATGQNLNFHYRLSTENDQYFLCVVILRQLCHHFSDVLLEEDGGTVISLTSFYLVSAFIVRLFRDVEEEEVEENNKRDRKEEEDKPRRTVRRFGTKIVAACVKTVKLDELLKTYGLEQGGTCYEIDNLTLKARTDALEKIADEEKRKKKKEEDAPSMWDYSARCMPKEFISLDQTTFLVDPAQQDLCVLKKGLLVKICEKLSPLDFLNLSLTCRFLHWRMFTFCTCYAPDTVRVEILDSRLRQKNVYPSFPKAVYYYGEGRQLPHMGAPPMSMETMYWLLHHGYRGFFVEQPSCLRRPFFFETLEVEIDCPFCEDDDFERCLSVVLPLRQYANRLKVTIFFQDAFYWPPTFNYPAFNDFLKAVKATTYIRWDYYINSFHSFVNRMCIREMANKEIYLNCPYARQMDEVWVDDLEDGVLTNRIGYFGNPSNSAVLNTIYKFLSGSSDLEFHAYYSIRLDAQGGCSTVNYLFEHLKEFTEYYSTRYGHIWYARIETPVTGERHVLRISKTSNNWVEILIGKDETFKKMEQRYLDQYRFACDPQSTRYLRVEGDDKRRDIPDWDRRWKMETAVELEEDEETEEDLDQMEEDTAAEEEELRSQEQE